MWGDGEGDGCSGAVKEEDDGCGGGVKGKGREVTHKPFS